MGHALRVDACDSACLTASWLAAVLRGHLQCDLVAGAESGEPPGGNGVFHGFVPRGKVAVGELRRRLVVPITSRAQRGFVARRGNA